jgi:hypothetical protein
VSNVVYVKQVLVTVALTEIVSSLRTYRFFFHTVPTVNRQMFGWEECLYILWGNAATGRIVISFNLLSTLTGRLMQLFIINLHK